LVGLLASLLPTFRAFPPKGSDNIAISSGLQRRGHTGLSPVSRYRNDHVILFFPLTILASEFQKINLLNKIDFLDGPLYF